ncbi:hypothetical protein Q8A67_000808 [Cirrhinus molitorella]|uniref:Ig-like domain-containing protein n=1 Tax=Cirrhinus molitorella TaxID=172907 RepID=A0AA88TZ42_9TELE|nr:hypothetical protein Q8A67_000808 [Cirrhinus molitorella]
MISSSLWLLLLLAAVSRVHCVELTQTDSLVLSPGQVLETWAQPQRRASFMEPEYLRTGACDRGIPNGKNQPTAAKEVDSWSAAWQHASLRQKLSWLHEVTSLSVNGQNLESIPSSPVTKKPGETLNLSCKGSGFDFGQYGMHWFRQPKGQTFIWMGLIWYDASKTVYAESIEGRIEITRDNSNSMAYLKLSGLTTEDSAVYYCAG